MQSNYYMFGIQRSGTNYLQQLIQKNFCATKMKNDQRTCWKHSLDVPKLWDYGEPTFVIYKNPYLWVESIATRNQVDWVATQKRYPADDKYHIDALNLNGFNLINLAKTWRDFHTTWLKSDNLNPRVHIVIKYENLLDPQKRAMTLNTIRHLTNWEMKNKGEWVNAKPGQVSQSRNFTNDSKIYYEKQQPQVLNRMQTGAITHAIGSQLISDMGYKIL